MLNQAVSLDELDGVILDFGGVLYDIDYDAPPRLLPLWATRFCIPVPSGFPIDMV